AGWPAEPRREGLSRAVVTLSSELQFVTLNGHAETSSRCRFWGEAETWIGVWLRPPRSWMTKADIDRRGLDPGRRKIGIDVIRLVAPRTVVASQQPIAAVCRGINLM